MGRRYINDALNRTTGDIRQVADVMVNTAEASLHQWLNLTLAAGGVLVVFGMVVSMLGGLRAENRQSRHAIRHGHRRAPAAFQTWPPLAVGALRRASADRRHPARCPGVPTLICGRDAVGRDGTAILGEVGVRAHLAERVIEDIAADPQDDRLVARQRANLVPDDRGRRWSPATRCSARLITLGIRRNCPPVRRPHGGYLRGLRGGSIARPVAKRNGAIPSVHAVAPPLDPDGMHSVEPLRRRMACGVRRLDLMAER